MKNRRSSNLKPLIASASVLLVLAVAFSGASKVSMAKIASEPPGILKFDGASDYVNHCNRCHGADGRGQTAKGRQTHAGDLTKSKVSDAKGIRMITNGSGEMPAFKDTMSAEQIRNVMAYTHGFRR